MNQVPKGGWAGAGGRKGEGECHEIRGVIKRSCTLISARVMTPFVHCTAAVSLQSFLLSFFAISSQKKKNPFFPLKLNLFALM